MNLRPHSASATTQASAAAHRPLPRLTELHVRVAIILVMGVGTGVAFCPASWPTAVPTGIFFSAVLWEGCRALIFGLRRRYPGSEQTGRRIALYGGLALAYVVVAAFALTAFDRALNPHIHSTFGAHYQRMLLTSVIAATVVSAIYESVYFFQQWRRSLVRAAELEKESAVSRLEALKQQVDPHFLFNSLNALAALIGDNEPAQDFLDELAGVYRYVLLSKGSPTVTLAEEMAFVDSYLYLNTIRFRDQIQVTRRISVEALRQHVPPIAVQMLVENAIKHNATSAECPLCITLEATAGRLSVSNNIQPKTTLAQGTRQGLQNITNRFLLLAGRQVTISEIGARFEVVLPLL